MIQVAVVDDHPMTRLGMAAMLEESANVSVIASVPYAADLGFAREGPMPDVILLDLYQQTDEPCLAEIARLGADSRVLVVSASGRPADVLGAIKAGASGYLTKTADAETLLTAVRTVAGGGFALSPKLADIVQAELLRLDGPTRLDPAPLSAPPSVMSRLSPREDQTVTLIAQGFTHAQVARRMGVTKATVDTYVERVRAKLQVGNKAELTRVALEQAGSGSPQ